MPGSQVARVQRRAAKAGALALCLLGRAFIVSALGAVNVGKLPPASDHPVDFAKDIRPILETSCYDCHGPQKQKSDFRLDQKASALKGGQNGVAIVPGKSADSPLIHFVAGLVEDMRMPPAKSGKTPLSADQVGLLRAWIDQGAIWPDGADNPGAGDKANFWTFKPAARPAVPTAATRGWARNEIDQFILARLEKEQLAPSPAADKRALLRRLSFDLTGLPPSPEDVRRFVGNTSQNAYELEVERLLNSPRYGERWARYWLDTVHFGETHGYDKDKTRPNAWPYRDYVVRALNDDKPYSRFVEEQLAGDVLYPDDPDGVVALGFIAAGPWDFVGHVELPESKTDGLIARYNDRDDMVMTTMSTFQSLTVHCARCHDHKFDPVSQEDYYALQAVFAGVDRADRWFDTDPATFRKRKRLLAEKKSLEGQLRPLNEAVAASSPAVFKLIDARIQEQEKQMGAARKAASEESPSNGYHSEVALRPETVKWVQVDLGKPMSLDEIRLVPARPTDFTDTPGFGFPVKFRVEVSDSLDFTEPAVLFNGTDPPFDNPGDQPVKLAAQGRRARLVRVTATQLWERTGDYVFALGELQVYSGGSNVALNAQVSALDSIESGRWAKKHLVDGYSSRKRLHDGAAAPTPDPEAIARLDADLKQLRQERAALVEKLVDQPTRTELARLTARLDECAAALNALPPPKMVFAASSDFAPSGSFKPAATPRPVHVLRRGEVKQPMHLAVPGAVSCLPELKARFGLSETSPEGERRAALAKWITHPKNLLTRRSIVNRVWQYHFGRGLVETPNDFGHMGALPTHPELLDWLAYWFFDHGESLKELHRLMVTSATYRQSSAHDPAAAAKDADNRFLWRMNRTRLDAEALRDSILTVSGQLDLTVGGPSVQQFLFKDDHSPIYDYTRFDVDSPAALRRSLYRFVVRSVPDPFMETMDCPDASLLAPRRSTTITALQSLALLNDPFVLRQAERFAQRAAACSQDPSSQTRALFELALSRAPSAAETESLARYGQEHGLTNVCRLVFNMSEFLFVD